MIIRFIILCILLLFPKLNQLGAQTYIPKTGPSALYQHALDLQSNLRILNIALKPGYEDIDALTYFRLAKGASIVSAYLTNGEFDEHDIVAQYPSYLAATRREEAVQSIGTIGGETYFLSFPDVAAARDTDVVRLVWPADSVRLRLMKLIADVQPDMIMISRDRAVEGNSVLHSVLVSDVVVAVRRMMLDSSAQQHSSKLQYIPWDVQRVIINDHKSKGVRFPMTKIHPMRMKSYQVIADEAQNKYYSLSRQMTLWSKLRNSSYVQIFPIAKRQPLKIESEILEPLGPLLAPMHREIKQLAMSVMQGRLTLLESKGQGQKLLMHVSHILDSVDYRIARRLELTSYEQRAVLHWKETLESLRRTLLGVRAVFNISESVVTGGQLTELTIDSLIGADPKGSTQLYIPSVNRGWILNEDFKPTVPLTRGVPYRLVSPLNITYNYPAAMYGLQTSFVREPFMFFLNHRASSRERSFSLREIIPLSLAPRFTVEILTPIVRANQGEQIIIRLTNNSRDGVADTVSVVDSDVVSLPQPFRLSYKGATTSATLALQWRENLPEGDYLVPIRIGENVVGRFAARAFDVKRDSTKRVGYVPGLKDSPLSSALRRLDVTAENIDLVAIGQIVKYLDVLIIDHRALSLLQDSHMPQMVLDDFVQLGGHLIMMSQDAEVWNKTPLFDGISLRKTRSFDERCSIMLDTTHQLLRTPNELTEHDFDGWIFQKAYNEVTIGSNIETETPIIDRESGFPLLVTEAIGRGRKTYVDLALQPQLMNIHGGAFRLLANLMSY